MNCTPEKCPHRALLEKARAACLSCDHIDPAGHGGVVSYDAAGGRIVQRVKISFDRSPRGRVTTLPSKVEERVAELFRRWCMLDTIDALLMHHVCNGGTCGNFGAYLDRVRRTVDRMDVGRDAFRATARARFQRLIRRFAPFLRGRLHAWDDGHGGAVRKEREQDERQPDLFEFMGAADGSNNIRPKFGCQEI